MIYPTEDKEQEAVIEWAAWHPGIADVLIAIPNGAHLAGDSVQRAKQMKRLKKQGLKPGVSDLFLAKPMQHYAGLWIEMKRQPGAKPRVSVDQLDWLYLMQEKGYCTALCYGADQAIQAIQDYLVGRLIPYHEDPKNGYKQKENQQEKDGGEKSSKQDRQCINRIRI